MIKLMQSSNFFYGSSLANSDINASDAYGWHFQFQKNSFQNTLIKYLGVFHLGARIRSRILSLILKNKDTKKLTLLDAGCGMGLASIYWSSKFKKVFGVDLDKSKIKEAQILAKDNRINNVSFKSADLLKNNFTKEKFDIVTCFEVIEHVKDYKKLIKTLSKRIKKGGEVILSFPSNSYISALAQKSLQHEVVGFLPKDIQKVSKQENLTLIKTYSFGNTILIQWLIALDFFTRKTFPIISPFFFPFFYPLVIIDQKLPQMGIPRGYILVLKKK
jgi:ubiquinone biosynthesis O-methyltransferase